MQKQVSKSWDLKNVLVTSEEDEYEYDKFGNSARVHTRFLDGSITEARNAYADDESHWFLGRLRQSTVTMSAPGKGSQGRTAEFAYSNSSGQLIRETALAGTSREVRTLYRRDQFGNKTEIVTSTLDGVSDRIRTIAYDTRGRFPVLTEDAVGQVSRTGYDDVSGTVLWRENPNGVKIFTTYDSLQRPESEKSASGNVTTVATKFPEPGPPGYIAFYVVKKTEGLPAVQTYYDAAGRVRLEQGVGAKGRVVVTSHDYDVLGRPIRASVPHFGGTQSFYVEQEYDELDRVIRQKRGDGSTITTTYDGLRTIVTDPNGHSIETVKDGRGRILYTVDALKHRTEFQYDSAGQLAEAINALGQITALSYDIAGFRTRVDDPILGTWKYVFDSYGELIAQTDSRGKSTRLKYDAIGRLVEKSGDSEFSRWNYHTSGSGAGQVAEVQTSGNESKSFRYDQFGRPVELNITYADDHLTVTQEYDRLGRLTNRTYSTGLSISYSYDLYGFCHDIGIHNKSKSETVWEAQDYSPTGRATDVNLGNGV
jgi:YD repeat-containing protein